MSLDINQIAEAFSTHRFATAYPYLSDNITWNILGDEVLMGREAVIRKCEESAKYLETVSTTFVKLRIIRADLYVVVDGVAEYQDNESQTSSVASCDIYQFSDEQLVEITSYNIELNKQ